MKNQKLIDTINKITSDYYSVQARDSQHPGYVFVQYIPANLNNDSKFYLFELYKGKILRAEVYFNDEECEKEEVYFEAKGDKLVRRGPYTIEDYDSKVGCAIAPYLIEGFIDDFTLGDKNFSLISTGNQQMIYHKDRHGSSLVGVITTHKGKNGDVEVIKFLEKHKSITVLPISKATFTKKTKVLDQLLEQEEIKENANTI